MAKTIASLFVFLEGAQDNQGHRRKVNVFFSSSMSLPVFTHRSIRDGSFGFGYSSMTSVFPVGLVCTYWSRLHKFLA
jgi:hypothetical protein